MKNSKGFTLVELLIAASIFVIVISTIYSAFHNGLLSYRNIEEAINIHQSAKLVLERIDLDLRNSFVRQKTDTGFLGEKNKLNFFTLVDNYSGDRIVRNYASVSYALEGDKLTRLCLRNQDSLADPLEIQSEEMSANIESLVFSYGFLDSNGKELKFQEFYNDKTKLPLVVKVELTLKGKTKYDFSRTIYLP